MGGKSKNACKSALEKLDLSTLKCREAVTEVAKILYAQHDPAKDKPLELELSWVCDESKRLHALVPPALKLEAEEAAKAARAAVDKYDSAASAARLIWVQLASSGWGRPRWS